MDIERCWIPSHLEIGTWKHCLYCGVLPDRHEHVVPVQYFAPSKRKGQLHSKGIVAPSCEECNALLGDHMFPTICERISYVNERLASRYRKVLDFPEWSEDELEDVAKGMADHIRANLRQKAHVQKRLTWIYSTSLIEIRVAAHRKAESLFPENQQLLAFLGCLD